MVEMRYTKFLLGQIKRKIFGAPKEIIENKDSKIIKSKKKSKPIKLPKINFGVGNVVQLVMFVVCALVGLTIFSQISSSLNTSVLSPAVSSMMNLIPLVMAGTVIIGIITMCFRVID